MFFESVEIEGVLVSIGRVMRPEQVEENLEGRQDVRGIIGGWYLCGDVHREMFDALVASEGNCAMQITVLQGASAGNYGVFAQQVQTLQHRFLLPLYEPPVIELLQSLRDKPVQLSLGRQNEGTAVLVHQRLPWSKIAEVLPYTQRLGEIRVSDVFAGSRSILDKARTVDTVACFPGMPRPKKLCVSFVTPKEALLSHAQLYGADSGIDVVH